MKIADILKLNGIEMVKAFIEAKKLAAVQRQITTAIKNHNIKAVEANDGHMVMGVDDEGNKYVFKTKPTEYLSKTDLKKALANFGHDADEIEDIIALSTRRGKSFDADVV